MATKHVHDLVTPRLKRCVDCGKVFIVDTDGELTLLEVA